MQPQVPLLQHTPLQQTPAEPVQLTPSGMQLPPSVPPSEGGGGPTNDT
ncbi:MAG: hypothetical protein JWM53_1047, partial [bacterium]|nr:hypothetical protein [bacterium]